MTQLLPNGKQQFIDINGKPLVGATLTHYLVGTSTLHDTYQNNTQTVLNTNPVVTDSRGQASIYGTGNYRQVLADSTGNQIWDQVIPDVSLVTTQFMSDLANYTDPTKGDALIGHYNAAGVPTTVQQLLNGSVGKVDSVFALLSAAHVTGQLELVASYFTSWAGTVNGAVGGGVFVYDSSRLKSLHNGGTIISPTVPWDGTQAKLAAFLAGTGETIPTGSGCWVRVYARPDVFMFGARGDNSTDDTVAFQKAIDTVKSIFIPNSTYLIAGQLTINNDGTVLNGENQLLTVLNCTAPGVVLKNPLNTTVTRLWCGMNNLHIQASSNNGQLVVDWTGMQHSNIDKVWFSGVSIVGCTLLALGGVWTVTQGTYNTVTRCYFGNMSYGISLSDGANNNTIDSCRMQPSASGGIGVLMSATAVGRISSNTIENCGFEYPGAISTGVNILQNCSGIRIINNRFEALLNGIVMGATGNVGIFAPATENYFSGCTSRINLSTGNISAAFEPISGGVWNGSGLGVIGHPWNISVSNPSTGVYNFTFPTAQFDNGYVVSVMTSAAASNVSAQTANGFTVVTSNSGGSGTSPTSLGVVVSYNK